MCQLAYDKWVFDDARFTVTCNGDLSYRTHYHIRSVHETCTRSANTGWVLVNLRVQVYQSNQSPNAHALLVPVPSRKLRSGWRYSALWRKNLFNSNCLSLVIYVTARALMNVVMTIIIRSEPHTGGIHKVRHAILDQFFPTHPPPLSHFVTHLDIPHKGRHRSRTPPIFSSTCIHTYVLLREGF